MRPAILRGIPVRVKNTFHPEAPGTLIVADSDRQPGGQVKSIVYKENVALIHVESSRMLMRHGFMSKLFDVLGRNRVIIDMIATSEVTLSMTTDSMAGVDGALEELRADRETMGEVRVETGKAVICVIGKGMRHVVGLASRVFGAVAESGVNIQMISQGASEINIAFMVNNEDIKPAIQALHREFFEKGGR
jgi:aspartate kinase